MREPKKKSGNLVTLLCPPIEIGHAYEKSEGGYSYISFREVPYTKLAKFKKDFGHAPRKSKRLCMQDATNRSC